MRHLIRLKVFLLCCLLVIGTNVMLIMSGFVDAGIPQGRTGITSGCDAPLLSQADPAGSRHGVPGCGYGFCAEKR